MSYPGRLIIFEGINAAGKTTLIKTVLESRPEWLYVKGLGDPKTAWGRFARRYPSTLTMLLELLISNYTVVRPALKAGKSVLHDRYFSSVMVFHTASRWHNRLLGKIFRSFLQKPDLIFLIDVSTEESLRRMKQVAINPFHDLYLSHPDLIDRERNLFRKLLADPVINIDTTKRKLTEAVLQVLQQIGGPSNGKNHK
jgi:thymidylate kinase